jgi:hypothetical protein
MPSVKSEDIYGNELDKLPLGQFILSDYKRYFINLPDIIDTVFTRSIQAETYVYLTTNEQGQSRNLTSNELSRLGIVHQELEHIRRKISDKGFLARLMQKNTDKLREELVLLRDGLKEGDVHHGGQEMEAGANANLAIVRFRHYYENLSAAKQAQICAITSGARSLGDIFNILFRDPDKAKVNDGTSVTYCMSLVGGFLEDIINDNREVILGINNTQQDCLDYLKNKLLTKIQQRPSIKLHASLFPTLQQQLNLCMDMLSARMGECVDQPEHAKILFNMACFIFTDCQRLLNKSFGSKLNCYADLLLAMGLEANHFDKRSHADRVLILNETYKRISLISSCSSAKLVPIHTPSSKTNWREWLQNNAVLQAFPFEIDGTSELKFVDKYIEQFPLNSQRQLATEAILLLRQQEASEHAVIQQAIVQIREQEEARGTILGFFRPTPPPVATAAPITPQAPAAPVTPNPVIAPARSAAHNPPRSAPPRWPFGATETAIVAVGVAAVVYRFLM